MMEAMEVVIINCKYKQAEKNKTRHDVFFHVIESLTTLRYASSCVERNYVRKVYDYFLENEVSKNYDETKKISSSYLGHWEKMHDSMVGVKKVDELVVCYLSGPEPENDFDELFSFGILPQNIWAFENDTDTFKEAIVSLKNMTFPQPKIIKTSMEQFFKTTPKKFDIIYVDACGSVISNKHTLRIISTLFKYHRLNSPGALITNFSEPDIHNSTELENYSKVVGQYMYFKNLGSTDSSLDLKTLNEIETEIIAYIDEIKEQFSSAYSEFITRVLMDVPSVIIPGQRFANSTYFNSMVNQCELRTPQVFEKDDITKAGNNSILQYLIFSRLQNSPIHKNPKIFTNKNDQFIDEFEGIDKLPLDTFNSLYKINILKNNEDALNMEFQEISKTIKSKNMHQFLDLHNDNIFLDLAINQLSYPMHYNTSSIKRYRYKAKQTNMYLDAILYDECRYIYEWVPTLHVLKNAFDDLSWQYTFRFALDGLVKNRMIYNNEFFYQGSVINKRIMNFKEKKFERRAIINE